MTSAADLASRHGLPAGAADRIQALLEALEAEPDPPTTIRTAAAALEGHVADSLVALDVPEIRAARAIADIGSGAGFPGLALALALPEARVDLVESARRKCAVIDRLAEAAGLSNARSVPARAEEWAAGDGRAAYEVVTARALASLGVLCEYAAPLLAHGGVLVAWKGGRDAAEEADGARAAAEVGLSPESIEAVRPFVSARARHLHLYRKVRPTPDRFPRRPGIATKRPL